MNWGLTAIAQIRQTGSGLVVVLQPCGSLASHHRGGGPLSQLQAEPAMAITGIAMNHARGAAAGDVHIEPRHPAASRPEMPMESVSPRTRASRRSPRVHGVSMTTIGNHTIPSAEIEIDRIHLARFAPLNSTTPTRPANSSHHGATFASRLGASPRFRMKPTPMPQGPAKRLDPSIRRPGWARPVREPERMVTPSRRSFRFALGQGPFSAEGQAGCRPDPCAS